MSAMKTASIARAALQTIAALFVTASAQPAAAQSPSAQSPAPAHFEFVVSSGRMMQTGAQRNAVKDGNMTAAQVWYVLNPTVAVTGTGGWTRSRDLLAPGTPKRDIFSYDLGAEIRGSKMPVYKGTTIKPFAGLGFGGETHTDRDSDVAATHNLSAYGSAGVEVGFRRMGLRVEARDYVSGFNPFGTAGAAGTHNDIAVLTGLRLGVR